MPKFISLPVEGREPSRVDADAIDGAHPHHLSGCWVRTKTSAIHTTFTVDEVMHLIHAATFQADD
jgi:hypothetical protein